MPVLPLGSAGLIVMKRGMAAGYAGGDIAFYGQYVMLFGDARR